jgi:hypothetical protein
MARIHPKLDHGTTRDALNAAASDLSARVVDLTDDQVMTGILRIVAMVSAKGCDAHTGMFIWGIGNYPVESLPLRLWWFDEGVYVVDALPPYGDLIGSRVDDVNGHPIADVLAAIDPIVPRDNSQTVRLLMPRYLLIPQVLRGLGLAGEGAIDLDVTPAAGAARTVSVEPVQMAAYNAWAGGYGLHLPVDPAVPYLSRIGDALWWEARDAGATLYVQWNRVDAIPFVMLNKLESALHDPAVTDVILDVRHNYGGEVSALNPILDLVQAPQVDRPGHLFLITGRNTFSAGSLAVARLDAQTSAIVVGEPMGGCPTAYGDSTDVRLPYGGIVVSVASFLEEGVAKDDTRPTIEPDLPARLTPGGWAAGADPASEAIMGYAP